MNKTFPKSYIIPPLEFTLDYIVLTYCLLDTTYFTYAEDNFIRVTSLRGRRLTAPSITTQLNQCREKMCRHPLKRILYEIDLYAGDYLIYPASSLNILIFYHI